MKEYKTCTKCKQNKIKSTEYFYADKGQSSGLKPECRDCTLALKKIYYQNNKKALQKRSADYRAANPEKWKNIKAEYRQRNPEKIQAERRRRYARQFGGNHKFYTVEQVLEAYGADCHLCGKPIDLSAPRHTAKLGYEFGLHIDHVVRLADGGDDRIENVRPAHAICNQRKG